MSIGRLLWPIIALCDGPQDDYGLQHGILFQDQRRMASRAGNLATNGLPLGPLSKRSGTGVQWRDTRFPRGGLLLGFGCRTIA